MTPALTVKSQVTIPKMIREYLGIGPGSKIAFEPLADGRVAIASTHKKREPEIDPITAIMGTAVYHYRTEDIMRMTRGDDWGRP